MKNLPELSARERREAPWNDNYPEPDVGCSECCWAANKARLHEDREELPDECPECGADLVEI